MDHIRLYLLPRIKNTTLGVEQTATNESNPGGGWRGGGLLGTLHGVWRINVKLFMETVADPKQWCCVQGPKSRDGICVTLSSF